MFLLLYLVPRLLKNPRVGGSINCASNLQRARQREARRGQKAQKAVWIIPPLGTISHKAFIDPSLSTFSYLPKNVTNMSPRFFNKGWFTVFQFLPKSKTRRASTAQFERDYYRYPVKLASSDPTHSAPPLCLVAHSSHGLRARMTAAEKWCTCSCRKSAWWAGLPVRTRCWRLLLAHRDMNHPCGVTFKCGSKPNLTVLHRLEYIGPIVNNKFRKNINSNARGN